MTVEMYDRLAAAERRTLTSRLVPARPDKVRSRRNSCDHGAVPAMSPVRSKLVFLDIDGTYAVHGVVPPGHEDAVRRVRAAGHRVFLCTGRSKALLPTGILDVGFDGLVASAGCYVEVGGNLLMDRRFPGDLARQVVSLLVRAAPSTGRRPRAARTAPRALQGGMRRRA